MSRHLTTSQIEAMINEDGAVVNIGQIGPVEARMLDKLAKQGVLFKYRGHWDTLSPDFGIGPLKSIWAWPQHPRFVAEHETGERIWE